MKSEAMERIVFDKMKKNDRYHGILNAHLQLYGLAHSFIYNKFIIDAACGTCFGSHIYSTAAKKILAVDKSQEAIDYGKKQQFYCPIEFKQVDLNKDILPKADVCVSIETIEHLDGTFFLEHLNVKTLIYSLPLRMQIDEYGYHKIVLKNKQDAVNYIRSGGWITKAIIDIFKFDFTFMGIAERV
jgi:predicted RNA methylase